MRVGVFADSVTMTYLRHRDFYFDRPGDRAAAGAYFREQRGDPDSPRAHVKTDWLWQEIPVTKGTRKR